METRRAFLNADLEVAFHVYAIEVGGVIGLDLTGMTFGHLLVIDRYRDSSKRSKWRCKCDCGNEVITRSDSLTRGQSTSCGKGIHSPGFIDLSGSRFGMLSVVSVREFRDNKAYWECLCDCGNTTYVEASNLRSGNTKSCGCLKSSYNDLSGMVFGDLLVIDRVNSDDGRVIYDCVCKCGNHIQSRSELLLSGRTHSCGCSNQSIACKNITYTLENNGISFLKEVCFNDLKSPKGVSLRYDFAILDDNGKIVRLVEYDGRQHMRAIDGWWGGYEGFVYRCVCDAMKSYYALMNQIPLVRIPYTAGNAISVDDMLGDKYIEYIA